ncbi:MAG: hypothetical protein ABEJ72_09085 [Candidatus Aenigmatarchaeota archaeon]
MICLLALIVFSVLGIFSARYRQLARQAFRCVVQKGQGNPCKVDLDRRMRNEIIGRAMDYDTRLASFIQSRFRLLSALVLIAMIAALIYSGISIYNWIIYGNCHGPAASTGCTLNQGQSLFQRAWETICFWEQ